MLATMLQQLFGPRPIPRRPSSGCLDLLKEIGLRGEISDEEVEDPVWSAALREAERKGFVAFGNWHSTGCFLTGQGRRTLEHYAALDQAN